MVGRPTVVEIDLDAVRQNFEALAAKVGGVNRLLGVVKADAYGHGAPAVAKVLEAAHTRMLGVATTDEAIELREAGIKKDILILGAILPAEIDDALKATATITVTDTGFARILDERARKHATKVKVHIKIDTGMGRIGVPHEKATQAVTEVSELQGLDIEGIFTHFPSSDKADKSFTYVQLAHFKGILAELEKKGLRPPLAHSANSAALLDVTASHFDMARPGISIYGYYPSGEVSRDVPLKPAMTLKTRIAFLKRVPPGTSVSYGRSFVTQRESVLATLPVGYADGYFRALSNRARMQVKGSFAPVVGRVCMDQTIVDVTAIPDVSVGDEVMVYSPTREHPNSVENIALLLGSIPNEVICAVGKRVPRVYKQAQP